MKKIFIFLIVIYSTNSFGDLYDDYITGNLEIADMLVINPDVLDYVGPLAGQLFNNGNDKGFGYTPNLLGGVSNSETEFLSFELHTQNLFQNNGMHFVVALRGQTVVPNILLGRGLAIKDTPGCVDGVAIEDFSMSAGYPGGTGSYLKGCKNFIFSNYSTYRIDMHASKNNIAFWIFKENSALLQLYGAPPWSLVLTGGCGGNDPYATCQGLPIDTNQQNAAIGTAFRSSPSYDFSLSNVYIAKF